MNFTQFGSGVLSIWVWFAASTPVFVVSVLLLSLDISKIGGTGTAFFRALSKRKSRREGSDSRILD